MSEIVDVDAKDVIATLEGFNHRVEHLGPTLQIVAEMLVSEVNDRWMSAGDGTWPDLAPSTKAARRGESYQILVDTGRGIGSLQAYVGEDYAEAASDVDYLKYHCGDAPRSRVPKRDPFELSDEALQRPTEFLLQSIAEGK
jgi:phage gpG-like protein